MNILDNWNELTGLAQKALEARTALNEAVARFMNEASPPSMSYRGLDLSPGVFPSQPKKARGRPKRARSGATLSDAFREVHGDEPNEAEKKPRGKPSKLLAALASYPQTVPKLAEVTGLEENTIRSSLTRYIREGKVVRFSRGTYVKP